MDMFDAGVIKELHTSESYLYKVALATILSYLEVCPQISLVNSFDPAEMN